MIDPQRHAENRGLIESFLRYVPGFRGYLEKDYRHESDYLVRKWMADRLQQSKPALDAYMLTLANAGRLEPLTDLDRVKNRLDGLILKMRAAVRGYSGFFDFVQFDVSALEQVYAHDLSLVKDVELLAASIEQLGTPPATDEGSAAALLRRLAELEKRFGQRAEMLSGLRPA